MNIQEFNYKLIGFDCPLGSYPSPLVPIVRSDNGEYKAVYLDDDLQLHTDPVVPTAKFPRLSDCDHNVRSKLENFDYRNHRLYALSESNLDFYETEDETYFFVKLLIDNNFSKDNPFGRVLLAEATGIKDLLERELQNYEQYLQAHKSNWLHFWNEDKKGFEEKIKQVEGISSQLDKIPVTGNKASELGVDYTNLRNLLQNKNFLEADKETAILMLQVLRAHKNININNFPKLDLRTIDKLWVIGSKGKFGFSVQKQKLDEIKRLIFLLKSDSFDSLVSDWYFPFLGMLVGIIGKTESVDKIFFRSDDNTNGLKRWWSFELSGIVENVLKSNGEESESWEGNGGRGGLLVMSKEGFSRNEVGRYVEHVGKLIYFVGFMTYSNLDLLLKNGEFRYIDLWIEILRMKILRREDYITRFGRRLSKKIEELLIEQGWEEWMQRLTDCNT